MADNETYDMDAAHARLEQLGLLQTKATATERATKQAKAVDGRSLRRTGRTAQINLKVTPAFADYLRREAAAAGLGVSQFVEQTMMGAKP